MENTIMLLAVISFLRAGAASGTSGPQTLEVKAVLSSERTLPGIPVSVRITFTNKSDTPIDVPRRFAVRVITSNDGEYIAEPGVHFPDWPERRIQPKGILIDEIATDGSMLTPSIFVDRRLLVPGQYAIQLLFSDGLLNDMDLAAIRAVSTASNVMTLSVAAPTGIDAQVWAALVERTGGTGDARELFTPEGDAFVRDVVARLPASEYTPWLVSLGTAPDLEERARFLRAYLSSHPEDPLFALRLLRASEWQLVLANKYMLTDPERSRRHSTTAQTWLQEVLRHSRAGEQVQRRTLERLEDAAEIDSERARMKGSAKP